MMPRRLFRCVFRICLVFIAVYVFLIYKLSTITTDFLIVIPLNFNQSTIISQQNTDVTTTLNQTIENSSFVKFNPFPELEFQTNKIMCKYSFNYFSPSIKRPLKRILFWNDAYGSKDYG